VSELLLAIPGDAVPWAAKTANPKTGMRFVPARQSAHAGKIIDAWERAGFSGYLLGEPLAIECDFFVRRPKGHWGTGRNARVLKERYVDARPTGRPDLSNLVKLIEDALTTLAWADDDQIVSIAARKSYTQMLEEQARSVIRIRVVD
jgi:Holliday junction resolvase RusA-like endonuclease